MRQKKQTNSEKQVQKFQDAMDWGDTFLNYGPVRTQRTPEGELVEICDATVSHEARLRWLLSACQKERPEIHGKLIEAFMSGSNSDEQFDVRWNCRNGKLATAAQIQAALKEIRAGIIDYVAGRGWPRRERRITCELSREQDQNWLTYHGPLGEALVAAAFDLVAREGHKIQRCAREKCERKKLFVRQHGKRYCSTRCSNLERTRRHRENPANRASQSASRHRQYIKQAAKRFGVSFETMKNKIKRRGPRRRSV